MINEKREKDNFKKRVCLKRVKVNNLLIFGYFSIILEFKICNLKN